MFPGGPYLLNHLTGEQAKAAASSLIRIHSAFSQGFQADLMKAPAGPPVAAPAHAAPDAGHPTCDLLLCLANPCQHCFMVARLFPSSSSDAGPSRAASAAVTAPGHLTWVSGFRGNAWAGLRADEALCKAHAHNELRHGLHSLAVAWLSCAPANDTLLAKHVHSCRLLRNCPGSSEHRCPKVPGAGSRRTIGSSAGRTWEPLCRVLLVGQRCMGLCEALRRYG